MSHQQLDILEEKINRLIAIVNQLQSEKNILKDENAELLKKIQEKEETIQQFRDEYQKFREYQDDSGVNRKREEEIKQKIESMLAKLDGLTQIFS